MISAVKHRRESHDGISLAAYRTEKRGGFCSVELRKVNLTYRNKKNVLPVLRDINLRLFDDDFVCVLGPSGCGKTSLLNVLAGYNTDIEGEVLVHGSRHNRPDPSVGVVFQQPNLFPWLSVEKNVEFGLVMKGVAPQKRAEISAHYIHLVDLDAAKKLLPHQLSGGMKQRAAIAMTLAADSKIVLLDEPFSGLDALTREAMQQHLRSIWQTSKKCFFFITHDVEEALLISTRILIMNAPPGRIAWDFYNPLRRHGEAGFDQIRASKDFVPLRSALIDLIQGGNEAGFAESPRRFHEEALVN
jgi:NitT/TauT family transport system ATP-binding protein/taurine transport system ATP-binding protein